MVARLVALLFIFICFAATSRSTLAQSEEQILLARNKGIDFLKKQQKGDGSWDFQGHEVGITALCSIALIENGVPLSDPGIQKAYAYVKKNTTNLKNTYDLSLVIVMLSRFGDRRDRVEIRKFAARLMAGQMDGGGWHYTCPGAEIDVEKVLRDVSLGPKPKPGYGDNSCTQFAVLGLWVASRIGVNVDKTMAKVSQRFKNSQADDGGWAYVAEVEGKKAPSGESMTGAGLFCLAVAQANQIRDDKKTGKKGDNPSATGKTLLQNDVFAKGFKRTGEFVKGVGPGSSRYFLWSVERVGVLLGLEQIGDVDWFQKGADGLLKTQREDGGWPSAWTDADKEGLSDTSFALLFLRKANLGSDISRLLEGEHPQKFEIVGRKPPEHFDTLEEAVAKAQPAEAIRVNGNGPWKVGNLELKQDVKIQAGFGYAPVFKFEVGRNARLGTRLKPETDPNGRHMVHLTGGTATLEGLRLQMDPPKDAKKGIAWRAITVKGGALRLLNCTISETNKQGTAGVVLETPGELQIRNCQLIGGKTGIELAASGRHVVSLENSIVFSNSGMIVTSDEQGSPAAEIQADFVNCVFQVKEVFTTPKYAGKLEVSNRLSVIQAEWIGSNFLVAPNDKQNRTWKGGINIYDVKQWIGANGKSASEMGGAKDWLKFWNDSERDIVKMTAPFLAATLRQVGNFSHDCNPQDWNMEFAPNVDAVIQQSRVGVNAYLAGHGQPFDQYRETIGYTEWQRGRVATAAAN